MGRFLFFVFCCLLFPAAVPAWTGYTHRLLAEKSLGGVARAWGLDRPVHAVPFEHFLEKLNRDMPQIRSREDFARWLKINPNALFDRMDFPPGTGATALEILARHAPSPDDGRDQRLPHDKLDQFWFGSGGKATQAAISEQREREGEAPAALLLEGATQAPIIATQAFRHMQKPPFDPSNPLNTFGFPLGSVGQATQRTQIYFDLAVLAHRLDEPYWAWNFLGCAFHYIQDLEQPYHTAQFSPRLLFAALKTYWDWGRAEKGFIPTLTHVISNAHHYFEGYVDRMLVSGEKPWIDALDGADTLLPPASAENLARDIRDFSNRYAARAMAATLNLTGSSLLGRHVYATDAAPDIPPEDPTPFFNRDIGKRTAAAAQLSEIVPANFKHQGRAARTLVKMFLEKTK